MLASQPQARVRFMLKDPPMSWPKCRPPIGGFPHDSTNGIMVSAYAEGSERIQAPMRQKEFPAVVGGFALVFPPHAKHGNREGGVSKHGQVD